MCVYYVVCISVYCASVCVYMYACMHACMNIHVCVSKLAWLHVYVYINWVYVDIWYVYVCVYIHVCSRCAYVYICRCMCVCVYMCVCTGTYMQVMLYVYMFVWLPISVTAPRLWRMSLWDNSSFLLSQPKNGCNRQVALHLPIVRKNWLESIVLKQKSIAFGSCPCKFNELIFKAPFSLEFNSVTPGAHHTDLQVGSHTVPAFLEPLPAPCEGPEDLIRKPSRLESPPTTDPPTFRGAKRHSTGFQGGEMLMPLLPGREWSPYWISWFPQRRSALSALPQCGRWGDWDHVVHLAGDFRMDGWGKRRWGGCRTARCPCIFWSLQRLGPLHTTTPLHNPLPARHFWV